MHSSHFD